MSWFGMKKAEFKPGFRDVRWGDAPVAGMVLLKKDGDEATYMRTTESMRIGEGKLAGINYQFWRGKLHGVVLQVAPGSIGFVMDALKAVYGKPSQPNPMKTKFYWMTLGSGDGATQAMVDIDMDKQSGTAIIFSKMLVDRRKAEEGTPPPA